MLIVTLDILMTETYGKKKVFHQCHYGKDES